MFDLILNCYNFDEIIFKQYFDRLNFFSRIEGWCGCEFSSIEFKNVLAHYAMILPNVNSKAFKNNASVIFTEDFETVQQFYHIHLGA